MIASQIEQFAANPIRRKQQVLVDRCLSKPLIGLNYEEAMKKLKRYIKHTVSEKTYLDRKFTRALTYEEQEQEVLNGNSLERELAVEPCDALFHWFSIHLYHGRSYRDHTRRQYAGHQRTRHLFCRGALSLGDGNLRTLRPFCRGVSLVSQNVWTDDE